MNGKLAETLQLFDTPTAEYRGKPFWCWNGKLEKEELLRQIGVLKEMGFSGFFMHSRTGLRTEYMGDEWFELINECSDEAEKLGMEAWLYDEDRWPSGTAGGIVTREPRFRLKFMRLSIVPAAEYEATGECIAAFHCRLDGLKYDSSTLRRLDPGERAEAPADGSPSGSVLVFTTEEQVSDVFYNGNTYLDTLNGEAVERFIELTHEKYLEHSGARLGKSIRGIFTDEPHRGALMDGFSLLNEAPQWLAPWTYTLFDRFREDFGYDLIERLPELFLQPDGHAVSQVKWHYVELLQRLFQESFAIPINDWCNRHGIKLTGHTLHEDSLTAQTAMVGSLMRFYEHMGLPGVDVLTEGNRCYWIVKQLSSVARQLGQPWLLSELYGCVGWQMDFAGHKAVGDWQALLGINFRCHHLSWYTMEGEAKRDFPGSIFYQSAWWRDYETVETYFSRLGVVLSQGEPICSLLVLNPVESVWSQVYPGWSSMLNPNGGEVQKLEQIYRDTFHLLMGSQIDFDYGDEEMLSRLADVGTDEQGNAVLRVGRMNYTALLVSGMTTMRISTLQLLERFMAAGGRVVLAGDAPNYVEALPSPAAEELLARAERTSLTREGLVELLLNAESQSLSPIAITDANGRHSAAIADIFVQARRDGDTVYVVMLNVDREEARDRIQVELTLDGEVEEWDCLSGARMRVEARRDERGRTRFTADFPPGGEHVYVVRLAASSSASPASEPLPLVRREEEVRSAPLTGTYAYRIDEPNVCVFDRASYRLDGEDWREANDILRIDRELRERLNVLYRSGEMLQPWFRDKYENETLKPLGRVDLKFTFTVDAETVAFGRIYLAVERPERLAIRINGEPLATAEGSDEGWWVDPVFRKLPVAGDSLKPGQNEFTLSLDFHEGFDLEALYLLGDFGVRTDGTNVALTALPDTLRTEDLTAQGFPFYGGTVTYLLNQANLPLADPAVSDYADAETDGLRQYLRLGTFHSGTVRYRLSEGAAGQLPWHPYELDLAGAEGQAVELDLVLSRRNTFGPLHQRPLLTTAYAPGNFVAQGEAYSEDYSLLPCGLLEQPAIVWKRTLHSQERG